MRRIWRRAKPKEEKRFRVNEQIRVPEDSLINEENEMIGVIPMEKALALAREAEMDLVEVNPKAEPPVVKIIDFGQFKYRMEKKSQKLKSTQKKMETKEIRLTVRISKHDFDFRLDQAKKFFEKGNKIKVEIALKGREKQHPEKAVEVINQFFAALQAEPGLKVDREQDLTKQGGRFSIILVNRAN